jgi:L-threonylcarbamoyladenylate synthase
MIVSVHQAVKLLKDQKLVAIPTETVYGLAGLADSNLAVGQIYKVKNRPSDNPLICHFDGLQMLQKYIPAIPDFVQILLQKLTPGPISFLLKIPANSALSPATGGRSTVVIRIPNHPIALEIIRQVGKPLAAPSANTSGKFSPTSAQMVQDDIGLKIAGIVDGGQSQIGLESTIVDCTDQNQIRILRQGAVGLAEIDQILANLTPKIKILDYSKNQTKQIVPGTKYKHYAPKTPLSEVQNTSQIDLSTPIAILGSTQKLSELKTWLESQPNSSKIELIDLGQNLSQISHNLYQKLFELDQKNVTKAYLISEDYGQNSLAKALQDKLERILEK